MGFLMILLLWQEFIKGILGELQDLQDDSLKNREVMLNLNFIFSKKFVGVLFAWFV